MIDKYCSINRVIYKVFTDLDLKEGTHRISDFINWGGEALEKIGAFPYFIIKTTGRDAEPLLELLDYQTKVPLASHKILQIAYATTSAGPFYPMRYSTGTFDYNQIKPIEAQFTDEVFSQNEIIYYAMSLFKLSYSDALTKINNEPETKELIQATLGRDSKAKVSAGGGEVETSDYTYVINGGYIKCNQKSGFLMVNYQSIPVDADGYPMIPDDPAFMEAVYWYIVCKLYYPEWKQGSIRDAVYYEAKRSWNYYCKQAYGNALMPNYDQMESIKNTWIRLIPDLEQHRTFYTKQGQREQYYNQDSPRYNSYYEKVFYK